jgi:hypothetical protein
MKTMRNLTHLAPVLFDGVIGSSKVITWNSWRNVVWDMHIYVMAKNLDPVKVIKFNFRKQDEIDNISNSQFSKVC